MILKKNFAKWKNNAIRATIAQTVLSRRHVLRKTINLLGKSCAVKKTADRRRVSPLFLPRNFPSRTSRVNFSVLVPNYRHCQPYSGGRFES